METSGMNLVNHWSWAAEKGLMNQNTAGAWRAACSQVLGVLENWESQDVRKLDIDATVKRFENLRKKDFKPQSLESYKKRFKQAIASFLEYQTNPSNWKPPFQVQSDKGTRTGVINSPFEAENSILDDQGGSMKMVEYPYPLRGDMIARLCLPRDLKTTEVKRLSKFLESLVVDLETD